MKSLLLGIGNDILGDDAIGIVSARQLKKECGDKIDVMEVPTAGLALLDYMEGYDRVLLLDAIVTGEFLPGTIVELSRDHFKDILTSSPHYIGLPEILWIAENLEIPFPEEICILAMEVENPCDFQEGLSPSIKKALPKFVELGRRILREWYN